MAQHRNSRESRCTASRKAKIVCWDEMGSTNRWYKFGEKWLNSNIQKQKKPLQRLQKQSNTSLRYFNCIRAHLAQGLSSWAIPQIQTLLWQSIGITILISKQMNLCTNGSLACGALDNFPRETCQPASYTHFNQNARPSCYTNHREQLGTCWSCAFHRGVLDEWGNCAYCNVPGQYFPPTDISTTYGYRP